MTDIMAIEECMHMVDGMMLKLKHQDMRIKALEDNFKHNFSTLSPIEILKIEEKAEEDRFAASVKQHEASKIKMADPMYVADVEKRFKESKAKLAAALSGDDQELMNAEFKHHSDVRKERYDLLQGVGAAYYEYDDDNDSSSSYEDLLKQEACIPKDLQMEEAKILSDEDQQKNLDKMKAQLELMKAVGATFNESKKYADMLRQEALGTKKTTVDTIEQGLMRDTHQELYDSKKYEDLMKKEVSLSKMNTVDAIERGLIYAPHDKLHTCSTEGYDGVMKEYGDLMKEAEKCDIKKLMEQYAPDNLHECKEYGKLMQDAIVSKKLEAHLLQCMNEEISSSEDGENAE
jgi:hypothetical protein